MPARKSRTSANEAPNGRLDAEKWTLAALKALSQRGIDGVRVEALARQLGVTKGSFYWHFKNRDELYAAMLTHWRLRSTVALIERVDQSARTPSERLKNLVHLMFGPGSQRGDQVELSIRLWGRHNERAAEALKEVDQLRIRYITRLLLESGVPGDEAGARAVLVYAYMRVAPGLGTVTDHQTIVLAEQLVFGVSEGTQLVATGK